VSSPEERHLRQLADGDSVFVALETKEAPSHVAALTILDPSTASEFSFEHYVEILRERIDLVPRFKWRLKEVLLGLDHGYWVEEPDFDIRHHVHRVALPKPGDRTSLAQLAGYLHARPVDRSCPLWESWWIEGLEHGRIATMMKIHHSLIDGQSGIGLSEILMDLTAEPRRDLEISDDMREPRLREPSLLELGRTAVQNGIRRQRRLAFHARRAARDVLKTARKDSTTSAAPHVPHVSFNGRLGRQRDFAFTSIPLAPLRDTKKHFDVRMNDVLLAIVASSLRHGLLARNELPEASLVALCPVSLREPGDQRLGNQITSMPVSLATDVEHPIARLKSIHENAELAKRRLRDGAFETITALGESLAPAALRLLMRGAHAAPNLVPLPGNLVFSNVRALSVPTYLAGARIHEIYPMSMLQVSNGINVTAVSHDDQVDFGFLVDPDLVPDPWTYADAIQEASSELERATPLETPTTAAPSASPIAKAPVADEPPGRKRSDERDAAESEAPLDAEPVDLYLLMSTVGRRGASGRRRV